MVLSVCAAPCNDYTAQAQIALQSAALSSAAPESTHTGCRGRGSQTSKLPQRPREDSHLASKIFDLHWPCWACVP